MLTVTEAPRLTNPALISYFLKKGLWWDVQRNSDT